MIPYGRQTITESDINEVIKVLRSDFLTQGPKVPEFEEEFSRKVGAKYSVAVNSATSGLHIACLALGVKAGTKVWTSSITFVASANCARYCGADVEFIDIDLETGLVCIDGLERRLQSALQTNSLPKCIILVHLCGTSCNMKRASELCRRYGVGIIEDASHAVGAKYMGSPVGSCKYSDICVFSFHPVKIITTGEGGMVTCKDEAIDRELRSLRSHGIERDRDRFIFKDSGSWAYEQQGLGFNYRMTDIQAALGLNQLSRLEHIVSERNKIYEIYMKKLEALGLDMLRVPEDCYSSHHLAVVRLKGISKGRHRQIFDSMRSRGVGVQLHYTPVHLQPYYRERGWTDGQLPKAEEYATTSFSLPVFPGLSETEQKYVIDSLKEVI